MKLCLDTSAIVKLKKNPQIIRQIANKGDILLTTKITEYELLVGSFFYGGNEQKFVTKILSVLPIVSVEEYIPLAAKLTSRLMKRGMKVNDFDVIIAATCIGLNMKIVTSDNHFNVIKDVSSLDVIMV